MMTPIESLLAVHPFFRDLPPEHWLFLVSVTRQVSFEQASFLFHEGEQAEHFYLIYEGKVALETFTAERGILPIETIEKGEALGWSWLFAPYRWHFSARVIEPVQALELDGKRLRTRCEHDHDFGYDLVKRVAQIIVQRLQATRLQRLDLYRTQGG